MKKQNFSAAVLLIPLLLAAVSCGAEASQTAETQPLSPKSEDTASAETESTTEARIPTSVPDDLRFEGETIRFLSRTVEDTVVRYYSEVSSTEANGESMNDAIYERTLRLEDRFGIKIKDETANQVGSTVTKAVNAGEDNWDVVIPGFSDAMSLILKGGYFTDLKSLPYIDLEKPWWDTRTAHEMSFAGKIYAAIGAMNTWTDSHTYAVVFNKELAAEFDIDAYSLVRKNQWTLDVFLDQIKMVTEDINGDGVMNEYDRWGSVAANELFSAFMLSSDAALVSHDKDDLPVYKIEEHFYQAADKVFSVLGSGYSLLAEEYYTKYTDPWTDVLRACFRAGRGLYYTGGIEQLIIFRDLETDIGLLPMPKYDEAQKDYAHMFSDYWASILCVPVTVSDTEKTGAVLEALNADSYYTTARTYYDVILASKAMRDVDSCEMLDIIRATRTYDMEAAFNFMNVRSIYDNIMKKKDAGILSSQIAKSQTAADKKIAKIAAVFAD